MASMRCLGIDHGAKRIGLSCGDELGVATPLAALTDSSPRVRWEKLAAVIRERRITDIVLGHPLNMDGTAGAKAKEVEAFAAQLEAASGLPVHLVDERLTSYEAEQAVPKRQRRAVRASGLIDSRAACLILQDFLNQHLPTPPDEP
jgi:putative Holliday junction resolvase